MSDDPAPIARPALRVLELFCGIGGAAAAIGQRGEFAWAVDTNQHATAVYAHNFDHPVSTRLIEAIPIRELRAAAADLWWMSPPCQPYTVRGLKRDLEDRRVRPFLHLVDAIGDVAPRYVAMENVPGFRGSQSHARLAAVLAAAGYDVQERLLCPTELGTRGQRRRFYLVAGRGGLAPIAVPRPDPPAPIDVLLDPDRDPSLDLDAETRARYPFALHRVDPADPEARLACFTSAYGRSPVRSGSYLVTPNGLRRLSPREILRSLGFPESFDLPPDLSREQAWRLVGNSLSVPAVRHVLSAIPELVDDADR